MDNGVNSESEYNTDDELDEHACPVCKSRFKKPKFLPCLHTVCRDCLVKVYGGRRGPINCPVCSEKVPIPSNGVDGFPYNVLEIRREIRSVREGQESEEIMCQNCSDESCAESWCHQCSLFLCEKCSDAHKRLAPYNRHMQETLAGIREKDGGQLNEAKRDIMCRKHRLTIDRFCRRCNISICQKCTIKDHHGHDTIRFDMAVKHHRENILKIQHIMDNRSKALSKQQNHISDERNHLDYDKVVAERRLERLFDDLSRSLQQQRTRMKVKLDAAYRLKEENLENKEREIVETLTKLDFARDLTNDIMHEANDTEVVAMLGQVEARTALLVERRLEVSPTQSRREPSIEFAEDRTKYAIFHDSLSNVADIKSSTYIPPTVIEPLEGTVVCGQRSNVTMVSFGENPKIDKLNVHAFRAELRDPDTIAVPNRLQSTKTGTYLCSFRPQIKGVHQLNIKMSGRHIKGSPMKFEVTSNNPMLTVGDGKLSEPNGVVVNRRTGTLYVTDSRDKKVVTLSLDDPDDISEFNLPFGQLYDITLDHDGNLVLSEQETNSVHIYSTDGEKLLTVENDQMRKPVGVAVDRESNILVADNEANCIFVFDRRGGLLQRIGSGGDKPDQLKDISFIALDRAGNIHVSNTGHQRITVYTGIGNFLRNISVSGHGRGKLTNPTGIASASGLLFVADDADDVIQIYTTEGAFVAKLDSEDDVLSGPQGVSITGDGSIAVVDRGNQCVKMYQYI
ncbi:E3 ubiquitin-protein ligase TRIM45-like [Saccoglossus kowalevskii]|uniref:Tripartite motif-containing protein 2-like n=1 Tax=Saccoglossus kowalevskii TaxID=10224 RepID=A0ABM0H0I7_SACKO|nr:PREDICTED: tripartite motif-containing protein 2-like [Saccoglossus kowalevskii]